MNHWSLFFRQIRAIFMSGFQRPGPSIYFFSIIVLAGGVGIWLPLVNGTYDTNSIMTYVFALLAASIADYLIGQNEHKSNKDISIAIIAFVILIIATTTLSVTVKSCLLAHALGVVSLILLWTLWWFLIEPTRFDLNQRALAMPTIGSDIPESDSDKTNLAAFRQSRSN